MNIPRAEALGSGFGVAQVETRVEGAMNRESGRRCSRVLGFVSVANKPDILDQT